MTNKKSGKIELNLFGTYISMIEKSVGTKMFQNLYGVKNGTKIDVTKNGENSCATYITAILKIFDLISERHATVESTVKDMKENGWYKIEQPRVGAIVTWGPWEKAPETDHIGFYMGDNEVISNYEPKKSPTRHHWTYGTTNGRPNRPVKAIYWHPKLEQT